MIESLISFDRFDILILIVLAIMICFIIIFSDYFDNHRPGVHDLWF